jgi:DNA-directed RNA polymerase specialized sigma24 family protein
MAETKRTVVARLFAEHRGALQAFLNRRVRRRPDAADLAQEVYVRLLRVRAAPRTEVHARRTDR